MLEWEGLGCALLCFGLVLKLGLQCYSIEISLKESDHLIIESMFCSLITPL